MKVLPKANSPNLSRGKSQRRLCRREPARLGSEAADLYWARPALLLKKAKEPGMKRSTDRIITSHAGSLHRPDDLRVTMQARRDGEPFDAALEARIKDAVKEVVQLQHENGV